MVEAAFVKLDMVMVMTLAWRAILAHTKTWKMYKNAQIVMWVELRN